MRRREFVAVLGLAGLAPLMARAQTLVERRIRGLVIAVDTFFVARSEQLASPALRHAILAVSPYEEFAAAGGLISYGGSIADASRKAGVCTGRVLKGEKPADIPIEQSTHLQLVINAKTAAALGLVAGGRGGPKPAGGYRCWSTRVSRHV